jgi:hypothetical protein
MRGYYDFYEWDEEGTEREHVASGSNLITTAGKNVILRYLARMVPDYSGAIAVGLDSTAAAAADVRLGIQTSKVPIIMKSVDYTNQTITYKGTLDPNLVTVIYEMGLISAFTDTVTGSYDSKLLAVFDPAENWVVTTSGGTESTLNTASRIGGTLRYATINTVSGWIQYDSFKKIDLSGYSDVDQVSFGHVSYSNRLTSLVVTFTDQSGLTSTYTQAVTTHSAGDSVAQYNIYRVARNAFTTAAGFNWSQVIKFSVRTNASATANAGVFGIGGWDFIGMIDTDSLNPEYVLVTRSSSATALATKTSGKAMDIEYKLVFNL